MGCTLPRDTHVMDEVGARPLRCVSVHLFSRRAVPLSKNEGVYVRDVQTGKVRAVMGPQAYLLKASEELWEKELSSQVDFLLK